MNIDLSVLSYKDKIEIDENISYDETFLEKSPIKKLENVLARGYIYQNDLDEYVIKLDVKGQMYILDSITMEEISYPFSFQIDEILDESMQNNQNTLDLLEFLWQNIVLEVPIRYTKSDAHNLKGDNWKVLTDEEEENKIDPRLQKLSEYYKGGE